MAVAMDSRLDQPAQHAGERRRVLLAASRRGAREPWPCPYATSRSGTGLNWPLHVLAVLDAAGRDPDCHRIAEFLSRLPVAALPRLQRKGAHSLAADLSLQ